MARLWEETHADLRTFATSRRPAHQRTAPPATSHTPAPATSQPVDSVDISPAADLAGRLSDIPDIRQDRVAAIEAAIADGTYETAEKLNGAVDRLLDEIG